LDYAGTLEKIKKLHSTYEWTSLIERFSNLTKNINALDETLKEASKL
jgi:hypothetical protein